MGKLGQDAKNLILGNDGSDKEPLDFKTELQKAIKAGLITKAEGTLLITSRASCDKLAELIAQTEEKEVKRALKGDGKEFSTLEEAQEYEAKEEKKEKDEKERKRQIKSQEQSLEQQIQKSQMEQKAKMKSEKKLEKEEELEIEKKG